MSSTPLNMSITPLSTLGLIDNTPSTLPPCFLGRSPSKARTPWVEGFWAAILTAWWLLCFLGEASVPGAPEFCYHFHIDSGARALALDPGETLGSRVQMFSRGQGQESQSTEGRSSRSGQKVELVTSARPEERMPDLIARLILEAFQNAELIKGGKPAVQKLGNLLRGF